MTVTMQFFGGAGTVTGSCTLVKTSDAAILVDCGLAQDSAGAPARRFGFDPAAIDAVVLTHGHLDHAGMIPRLYSQGFSGKLLCHYATGELAKIIWEDVLRLSANDVYPPFDMCALHQALESIVYLDYGQEMVAGFSRVKLFDAGHILGSAHIELNIGDKRILFSGDIGQKNTPIIEDPNEQWAHAYDAAVIESTYGNRTHKRRADTIAEFRDLIFDCVSRRGVLLIPAFAIGRTQEIIYHINALVESGTIPPVPVLIDSPMAAAVTELYQRYTVCYDDQTCEQIAAGDLPLEFPGLHAVTSYRESCAIARMRPPMIVIAGSGMCTGGRILGHLKTFIEQPTTTIMLVGWQAAGTIGRALAQRRPRITIDGGEYAVNARVATLNGFSAHADKPALLGWAQAIPRAGAQWFVNHGEPPAAQSLAEALESAGLGRARAVGEEEVAVL